MEQGALEAARAAVAEVPEFGAELVNENGRPAALARIRRAVADVAVWVAAA